MSPATFVPAVFSPNDDTIEYRMGSLRYRILNNDLVFDDASDGTDTRRVALSSITHVRMYIAQGRGYCILTPRGNRPIMIMTAAHPPRDKANAYASFVRTLHRRLAREAPNAKLIAGHGAFFALHIVCCITVVLFSLLFVAALVSGIPLQKVSVTTPSILLPMLALASTSKGRPRPYSRGIVPSSCLPE